MYSRPLAERSPDTVAVVFVARPSAFVIGKSTRIVTPVMLPTVVDVGMGPSMPAAFMRAIFAARSPVSFWTARHRSDILRSPSSLSARAFAASRAALEPSRRWSRSALISASCPASPPSGTPVEKRAPVSSSRSA